MTLGRMDLLDPMIYENILDAVAGVRRESCALGLHFIFTVGIESGVVMKS